MDSTTPRRAITSAAIGVLIGACTPQASPVTPVDPPTSGDSPTLPVEAEPPALQKEYPPVRNPAGEWDLVSIGGQAIEGRVNLYVDRGEYFASVGCNDMFGELSVTTTGEGVGTFALGMGRMTTKGCGEPGAHERDAMFSEAFGGATKWESDGRVLRLTGTTELVFEIYQPMDQRLQGPMWHVHSFELGTVRASTVAGTVVALDMASGRYDGHTGCRPLHGRYQTEGEDGLHFDPPTLEGPPCQDPDVAEQEREYIAILEAVTTWAIEGDRLELNTAGDKGLVLFFVPPEE